MHNPGRYDVPLESFLLQLFTHWLMLSTATEREIRICEAFGSLALQSRRVLWAIYVNSFCAH